VAQKMLLRELLEYYPTAKKAVQKNGPITPEACAERAIEDNYQKLDWSVVCTEVYNLVSSENSLSPRMRRMDQKTIDRLLDLFSGAISLSGSEGQKEYVKACLVWAYTAVYEK